jgi:hypothetical protein
VQREGEVTVATEVSEIQYAEDAALDHQLLVEEVIADGIVTPPEQGRLRKSATRLHRAVRRAHFTQRAGISCTRRGVVAARLYVEFADVAVIQPGGADDADDRDAA